MHAFQRVAFVTRPCPSIPTWDDANYYLITVLTKELIIIKQNQRAARLRPHHATLEVTRSLPDMSYTMTALAGKGMPFWVEEDLHSSRDAPVMQVMAFQPAEQRWHDSLRLHACYVAIWWLPRNLLMQRYDESRSLWPR